MFGFRQKIFVSYVLVFLLFILLMFPLISHWVNHLVIYTMETRTTEIIANTRDAPNNEALIRRLKEQKGLVFFRISVITNEHKVLYDSHTKRLLGPKFSQEYVVDHPEVVQAFQEGVGYHEEYSKLMDQKFSYFAKTFDFHGRTYVLRSAFPHQYVSELVHDLKIGFLGFAAVILLLFSFMTWFIIHYLTHPIHKIIKAVKSYQEGSQNVLPAIELSNLNPYDEFSKLASTLNSLSAKIQNHINTLTAERNEKEAILESLVEGVIAVDGQMQISYVNHMASKLISIDKELIGHHLSEIGQEKCFSLLERCQKEKTPLNDALELQIGNKKMYLDIVAAPKKADDGAILVVQDKTAHHEMSKMKRDFVANASHELKTPITIIRGFAEALHDNVLSPETQREITTKIVKNCQRMVTLIKDLLTLADAENIPSSRLSHCDLYELTQRCRSMVLEVFPDTDIQINKPNDEDIYLVADVDLMELAIMNLVENAAKYSMRPAHIRVDLENHGNQIKISVADRGIGIPKADQEHIFERFYTVDKARSRKMGGSGLGLSIVKTIVEKHFGSINLYSEKGQGTTFTILLPNREIHTF